MKIKLCYFNQHWNVYLYSDEPTTWKDWCNNENNTPQVVKKDGGSYRLTKYSHPEIPVYSFGFLTDDIKQRPGHGGEWSSNALNINEVFNTDLIEIALDQMSCSVPIPWLKELLGDNVTWQEHPIYQWIITDVKGYTNESHKWIELVQQTA